MSGSLPSDIDPTDALASLAFTGNTSALSSSALAALTSRLSHRASSEALDSTDPRASSKKPRMAKSEHGHGELKEKKGKAPEWTAAFAVLPVALKEKSHEDSFDPYAEVCFEGAEVHGSKKTKDSLRRRPSPSFFRLEKGREREQLMEKPMLEKGRGGEQAISQPGTVREVRDARRSMPFDKPSDIEEVVSRCIQSSPSAIKRWTIAMADVPDEVLVQELERMRTESRRESQRRRRQDSTAKRTEEDIDEAAEESASESEEHHDDGVSHASHSQSHSTSHSHSHSHRTSIPTSPSDDAEWKVARRALLSCRELVRTERNYQASLRQLLAGQTQTAPPPLALSYVPALLRASEALLTRFEDDPSTWGVSVAFVAIEEDTEVAFVGWAGVVGEVLLASEPPADDLEHEKEMRLTRRFTRASRNSSLGNVGEAFGIGKKTRGTESVYSQRGVSSYDHRDAAGRAGSASESTSACASPRTPPTRMVHSTPDTISEQNEQGLGLFTAALGTGLAYGISPAQSPSSHGEGITKNPNDSGTLSRTLGAWKTKFLSSPSLATQGHHSHSHYHPHQGASYQSVPGSPRLTNFHGEARAVESRKELKTREKLPSVRELAVLPVQRIMRYVLQYRGAIVRRVMRRFSVAEVSTLTNLMLEGPLLTTMCRMSSNSASIETACLAAAVCSTYP
ncbi:uncharacterized protein PHACADRAFT_85471 [Phanerochaete carnosa HHB-10118-sp]|uniref:DH domain-containing protein n=1 Tax=Phanerochaete carnosa (strain HHB-10118-sp) TaxID=650164 RepID=K5VFP6_PHACS|nr:uncharacterized protein PHACADRAFT_85471 [Phanerochaete carnosa HHB-10118-sp]EKM61821.1 hypothetical protein PHACADRAFT_85471 [Phanerochaete carnosa HHB-10118-sp]